MAATTPFRGSGNPSVNVVNSYGQNVGHPRSLSVIAGATVGTEESDDEDKSSEVSEGHDLCNDLEEALQGDFDFKGSFYYGALAPTAPNPCLNIEGLGSIGLPLGERDARAIIDVSARAPFGMGSQTVVDSKVRDTWEIEPSKVKFDNPAWTRFIQDYVIPTVWQALGVAAATVPPKCELYKLLLYEPGSHFLPHQDTEKSDGMFATAIIVLPSLYTGGEVHVSHSSTTKVLDFASHSLLSTALLAWYTDVVHEVKPLKSGYRLALSYNLIHTIPSIPKPVLPDMSEAVSRLRHVLRKWQKSAYENEELPNNFVAYLLEHKYSEMNLRLGKKCLKGADAHLVTNIGIVAAEFGYNLYLANLVYCVSGTPDSDGYNGYSYRKRGRYRYGYDSDSDDGYHGGRGVDNTPGMEEVIDTSMTLKNVVDLEGSSIVGNTSLAVSQENLIPEDPFEDVDPDEASYEGYMGNYAGSLEHWYRRTVLIIIHEDDVDGMIYSGGGGVEYALHCVRKADPNNLTSKDRRAANTVLTSLNATQKATATVMFECAVKWKHIEMWKMVIKKSGSLITTFEIGKLFEAWKVFGFERVRQSFEDMLQPTLRLGARVEFIQALAPHAKADESEMVKAWAETQTKRAVASFTSPTKEDIPILISIGQIRGAGFLVKEILPQLTKNTAIFEFMIAFVKALHENKVSIPEQPPSSNPGETTSGSSSSNMKTMIETLLNAGAAQWSSVVVQPYPAYGSYYSVVYPTHRVDHAKIQRIISIIETCLLTAHMKTCNQLFLSVLKMDGTPTKKFETLYTPLIPPLRNLMNSKGIDLCTSPFSDLLQLFVGSYLRDVLGSRPPAGKAKLRKIGCGQCMHCNALDSYLLSPRTGPETFRLVQKLRLHLEARLSTAPDLVSFVTIRTGSPHGVQVTKVPEIVAVQGWDTKVAEAKKFLLSIGDDAALGRLMGNRFADVQKALSGEQAFILTVGDAGRRASTQAPTDTNSVAGVKRKNATGR